MRAISFIVAALAAKASAEEANEAKDNAYLIQAGYPGYMGIGEPVVYGAPYGAGYVMSEPTFMTAAPHYVERPHYPLSTYEEPRARLIEVPEYGPHLQQEIRYVVAPDGRPAPLLQQPTATPAKAP